MSSLRVGSSSPLLPSFSLLLFPSFPVSPCPLPSRLSFVAVSLGRRVSFGLPYHRPAAFSTAPVASMPGCHAHRAGPYSCIVGVCGYKSPPGRVRHSLLAGAVVVYCTLTRPSILPGHASLSTGRDGYHLISTCPWGAKQKSRSVMLSVKVSMMLS